MDCPLPDRARFVLCGSKEENIKQMGESNVPEMILGICWALNKCGWKDGLRFPINTMKNFLTVSTV